MKDIFNEMHRPNDGPMHYFYKLSKAAHEGVERRDGRPYISHPRRVADRVKHMGDHLRAAAWMHDVVEDTPLTLKEIGNNAFGSLTTSAEYELVGKVMEIIDALTHRKDEETYLEYLTRVRKAGPDAILVKTADIMDNFADHPTPAEMIKYPAALLFLAGEDHKGAVETLAGFDNSKGKKEAKAKGKATVEAATRRM